jgi:hypothetical protein
MEHVRRVWASYYLGRDEVDVCKTNTRLFSGNGPKYRSSRKVKSREIRDTVVDISTRLPNGHPRDRGTIPCRSQRLLSLQNLQTGLGSLSPGVKLPGHEADHSRPTFSEVNQCSYTVPISMHLLVMQRKAHLSLSVKETAYNNPASFLIVNPQIIDLSVRIHRYTNLLAGQERRNRIQ